MAHHEQVETKNTFGFWIYIMSDCLMFAALFATFAVLRNNIHEGLPAKELFSFPFVLAETIILLTSSFTFGLGILNAKAGKQKETLLFLFITFLLGFSFIVMEIYEFLKLIHEGASPEKSGFLSAFFTLVGTHGLHVTGGLIWILLLMIQIKIHGINPKTQTKIFCLGLFWHFLDIVWIFVFTIVYLMGAI
jgi:cytochrome o ubiquinol oxidase subunit 3